MTLSRMIIAAIDRLYLPPLPRIMPRQTPEIAAFLTAFPITFLTGLWLARNVSFRNSPLRTVTQGGRYFMVVVLNIVIKYSGLKLLVEVIGVYPSISNAILTVVTVVVSYLLQKNFSFRGHTAE